MKMRPAKFYDLVGVFLVALALHVRGDQDISLVSAGKFNLYYITPPSQFTSVLLMVEYQRENKLSRGDWEEELRKWSQVAAQHHLAMGLLFGAYDQTLGDAIQNGTLTSEDSQTVSTAITHAFGRASSVCFFPFDDWRDSVLLTLGLGGSRELNVAGWGEWNYVPVAYVNNRRPCLLIATDDYLFLPQLKDYFAAQQERTRKASLLIYKPVDKNLMKEFVCQYFEAVVNSPTGEWVNGETNLSATADDVKRIWMPNSDISAIWAKINTQTLPRPTIIDDTINSDTPGISRLHLFLRLPMGQTDGTKVSGVLAYCSWVADPAALMQDLMVDTNRVGKEKENIAVQMVQYAQAHNLALLTWSTPGTWNAQVNSSQLLNSQQSTQNREFQIYSKMWNEGVDDLVRKTGIPSSDYLLYGMSRGAQWAHRLALRMPERFLAINIHVASSYDVPTPEASHCLWLVTTGELEHGYAFAKDFYEKSSQMGYPIVFKAEQNLGHNSCAEVEELRNRFFDYALELKKEEADKKLDKDGIVALAGQRLSASAFFGDILNQELVSPSDAQSVPPTLLEHLPNDGIAQAWATVHVPEVDSR